MRAGRAASGAGGTIANAIATHLHAFLQARKRGASKGMDALAPVLFPPGALLLLQSSLTFASPPHSVALGSRNWVAMQALGHSVTGARPMATRRTAQVNAIGRVVRPGGLRPLLARRPAVAVRASTGFARPPGEVSEC